MSRATLQQERSRATRKAIMAAAESLWRSKDFDAVSVEDVCQKAGVAKGTFYFYFPRKEHLLVMLVFARFSLHERELRALLDSEMDTVSVCIAIAETIGQRAEKLPKPLVFRGVAESFRHYIEIRKLHGGERVMRWFYEPVFLRGQTRGEVCEDWDPIILATAISWAILQGIIMWATDEVPPDGLVANLKERAELLANGAATQRLADGTVASAGKAKAPV